MSSSWRWLTCICWLALCVAAAGCTRVEPSAAPAPTAALNQQTTPAPIPATPTGEEPDGWLSRQVQDFLQRLRLAFSQIQKAISAWAERTAQRLRTGVYQRLEAMLERVCGANPLVLLLGAFTVCRCLRKTARIGNM